MDRYIGDLEEVFTASWEYLETGGLLGFTCELISPEECAKTEARRFPRLVVIARKNSVGVPESFHGRVCKF